MQWATCGISALAFPSVDTAPFGFGLRRPRRRSAALRNRAIGAAIDATVFRASNRTTTRCAAGSGSARRGRHLRLHPLAVPLPAADGAVVRVPAQRPAAAGPVRRPAAAARAGGVRRARVVRRARRGRPVVLVTQGTVATDPAEVILPGARGAARRGRARDRRHRRPRSRDARAGAGQRARGALRAVRRADAARVRVRHQRRLRRAALRTRARRSGRRRSARPRTRPSSPRG